MAAMSDKKRGLGRGLEALLGQATTKSMPGVPSAREQLAHVPVDLLSRGRYQPRVDMREESLAELADSIKAQGVVQPIVVRPLGTPAAGELQRYEIVAGERRWRAARMAGLTSVPALVREVPDRHALAIALIENLQREDLNPLEEAAGVKRLIEEFGMTHVEAAEALGRSRVAVTNALRLLELAPPVHSSCARATRHGTRARAARAAGLSSLEIAAHRRGESALGAAGGSAVWRAGEAAVVTCAPGGPGHPRPEEEVSQRLAPP